MKPLEGSRRYGLFEELEIAAFAARHAAGLLHILQELTQIVALRRLQASEANANPGGGGASRHDSAERKALDPDFPARDPKPNLTLLGGRLSISLQQFADLADQVGVGQDMGPVGPQCFRGLRISHTSTRLPSSA